MSLPISTLQSLISHMRAALHCEYEYKSAAKENRSWASQAGFQEMATSWHNSYQATGKKIVKLEATQRALKKQLAYALSMQRAERLVANGWLRQHLESKEMQEALEAIFESDVTRAKQQDEEKGKAWENLTKRYEDESWPDGIVLDWFKTPTQYFKDKAEEKGKAAREAAMLHTGEFY